MANLAAPAAAEEYDAAGRRFSTGRRTASHQVTALPFHHMHFNSIAFLSGRQAYMMGPQFHFSFPIHLLACLVFHVST
jgi:hypothetical protein